VALNLFTDGLSARLTGGSGNMSRVCWVGRRFSREGFLFDAHEGCHGQQSGNRETRFDSWDSIFRIQFMCCCGSRLDTGRRFGQTGVAA
jgi:hypothetical protein